QTAIDDPREAIVEIGAKVLDRCGLLFPKASEVVLLAPTTGVHRKLAGENVVAQDANPVDIRIRLWGSAGHLFGAAEPSGTWLVEASERQLGEMSSKPWVEESPRPVAASAHVTGAQVTMNDLILVQMIQRLPKADDEVASLVLRPTSHL